MRLWSVRHSRLLEWFYARFASTFLLLHPLWKAIGYARVEAPVTSVERQVKGLLFDCRMCGQCILSSTGMSCPMNCPKQLRNGPCGGVRANGNCEVEPRSEEHTSELQSLMRISYAVFCLKKKNKEDKTQNT